MRSITATALAGAALVTNAGQFCFPVEPLAGGSPNVCVAWQSTANTTTMTVTCNPLNTPLGNILNWCAIAQNPAASPSMFPAEVWILIPSADGTQLVVENRLNVAHAIPSCLPTQLLTLVNSSITVDPVSGGHVLEASWVRPRYITDSTLTAEGHVNLTGSVNGGPIGSLIVAAAQAPYTKYAPCDNSTLEFHTYYNTGMSVDWDL